MTVPFSNFTDTERKEIEALAHDGTDRALSKYVKGALVGFAILLFGVGFVNAEQNHDRNNRRKLNSAIQQQIVTSGRAVAVSGCNRDYKSNLALRGLLTSARQQTLAGYKAGRINYRQYREADKFYTDQIANIVLPDCRQVKADITLDPNHPTVVPTPLYPKQG